MGQMNFSSSGLGDFLRSASSEMLDELDFGVVQMNLEGIISDYNAYESSLASISRNEAVGKNFFTQIAPCTNNNLIAGRFLSAPKKLDLIIDYIFTYRVKPMFVKLRLIIDPEEQKQFLLVQQV
jgi:photoactive yellow protein